MSTVERTVASTEPTVGQDDDRAAQMVAWSLRLFGGIDLLALIAVLMPIEWMQAGHRLCGLGEFPDGPLAIYLSRSTSLLWAFHGALLLYLSKDVRKHSDVIRFVGRATVLAGLMLLAIDLTTGIPWWWTSLEGPVFAASGVWMLWWLDTGGRKP